MVCMTWLLSGWEVTVAMAKSNASVSIADESSAGGEAVLGLVSVVGRERGLAGRGVHGAAVGELGARQARNEVHRDRCPRPSGHRQGYQESVPLVAWRL
jgi:hypothetical protein